MAAVEQQGRYFQREFGYDFLPYTAREHVESGDDQMGAYLMFDYKEFATATMRPICACSFRYTPKDLCWVLGWAGLHPFARRRGHLRAAWPTFRRQYGAFVVERPLSDAMAAFTPRRARRRRHINLCSSCRRENDATGEKMPARAVRRRYARRRMCEGVRTAPWSCEATMVCIPTRQGPLQATVPFWHSRPYAIDLECGALTLALTRRPA